MSPASLWIFGYGSLVWRPAFPHLRACPASISGFARRFWQGSTDHRGIPARPGRVVTLLHEDHPSVRGEPPTPLERCWGTAYEIPVEDPNGVLANLDHRERGGYERVELSIEVRFGDPNPTAAGDRGSDETRSSAAVPGLVYIAGPENANYLGPAPIEDIARQISTAHGPSGANPEYVFELANHLREIGAVDAHVFAVEAELARLLAEKTPEISQLE